MNDKLFYARTTLFDLKRGKNSLAVFFCHPQFAKNKDFVYLCKRIETTIIKTMKKRLFSLLTMTFLVVLANAQSLGVFIFDENGPYSNVRNSPNNGKVVDRIPVNVSAMLGVEKPVNGWWRIVDDCYDAIGEVDFEEFELKGSTTGYWIHYSVIAVGTRNYGREQLFLRSEPKASSRIVYTIKEETLVRPVEIKGDWVKVKTIDGKGFGWIEADWLCGNSVTNCC